MSSLELPKKRKKMCPEFLTCSFMPHCEFCRPYPYAGDVIYCTYHRITGIAVFPDMPFEEIKLIDVEDENEENI